VSWLLLLSLTKVLFQARVHERIQEIREKDRKEREESLKIAKAHPIVWTAVHPNTPLVSSSPAVDGNPTSPDTLSDLASSGVTPALGPVKAGSIDVEGKPGMKHLSFATGIAKDGSVSPVLIPDISI
jgi:hypothetical protein